MKLTLKVLHEEFVQLKELIRSQGYTVEVHEKLDAFDSKLDAQEKELRDIMSFTDDPKILRISEGECFINVKEILGVTE